MQPFLTPARMPIVGPEGAVQIHVRPPTPPTQHLYSSSNSPALLLDNASYWAAAAEADMAAVAGARAAMTETSTGMGAAGSVQLSPPLPPAPRAAAHVVWVVLGGSPNEEGWFRPIAASGGHLHGCQTQGWREPFIFLHHPLAHSPRPVHLRQPHGMLLAGC